MKESLEEVVGLAQRLPLPRLDIGNFVTVHLPRFRA